MGHVYGEHREHAVSWLDGARTTVDDACVTTQPRPHDGLVWILMVSWAERMDTGTVRRHRRSNSRGG